MSSAKTLSISFLTAHANGLRVAVELRSARVQRKNVGTAKHVPTTKTWPVGLSLSAFVFKQSVLDEARFFVAVLVQFFHKRQQILRDLGKCHRVRWLDEA